jgi:F-type H+-transporting ATPase subunit a
MLLRLLQEHAPAEQNVPTEAVEGGVDLGSMVMHHLVDAHEIELPWGVLHLPTGWNVDLGPLGVVDFAPTKHVVFMVLSAVLCLAVFLPLAAAARRRDERTAPKGMGGGMEALVLYFRDEVVRRNIGHGADAYVPYILTLFFFILFMNLLGLVPWGGSATGNISVTMALALLSFILIEISGVRALGFKGYLGTIFFAPHGMHPVGRALMMVIMTPVEFLGKLTKPFALMIRLFANMTAGHTLILSLGGLIFVFMNAVLVMGAVGVASTLMATAIMVLEVFVAFLQAYIFAMLTCVFIGLIRHAH